MKNVLYLLISALKYRRKVAWTLIFFKYCLKSAYITLYLLFVSWSVKKASSGNVLLRSQGDFWEVGILNPCHLVSPPVRPHECCTYDALLENIIRCGRKYSLLLLCESKTAALSLAATPVGTDGFVNDGAAVHLRELALLPLTSPILIARGYWLMHMLPAFLLVQKPFAKKLLPKYPYSSNS